MIYAIYHKGIPNSDLILFYNTLGFNHTDWEILNVCFIKPCSYYYYKPLSKAININYVLTTLDITIDTIQNLDLQDYLIYLKLFNTPLENYLKDIEQRTLS